MKLLTHSHRLRSLVPQAARERMYEWHPGRGRRWRQYPGIERVEGRGQAVLTFDDGPDEVGTPAVLDALDATETRATFFLLATQVIEHPEIAREVVTRGHEVGLHGYEHYRHDRIEPALSRGDVTCGVVVIEELLGLRCRWYRPPYGKMSPASADACRVFGMTPVYWSAWGLDWERVEAERIAKVAGDQIDDGAIVLLHDSARYARRPTPVPTALAIPLIVEQARQNGISFVSLGAALADPGRVAA